MVMQPGSSFLCKRILYRKTNDWERKNKSHFHLLSSSSGDYAHDRSSFEAFGIYMEREEIEIQGAAWG